MKTSGLVHLYCGDGKGKTTAAVGLAVRHAGHGGKVVFAQFLKDGSSGECRVLAKLGVTVLAANPAGKFTFCMTDEEKAETAAALGRTFDAAAEERALAPPKWTRTRCAPYSLMRSPIFSSIPRPKTTSVGVLMVKFSI